MRNIRINDTTNEEWLLLLGRNRNKYGHGDNIMFEDDSTSVGENIILEGTADTGDETAYLLQETYIVGDATTRGSQDKDCTK